VDEEHPKTGGSVPHNYGNALARRWARELPRPLTGGFLTLLYALRAMASADGRLRYERDGAPITIQQIATACRSDQKDVRVYLNAAVAAGVVTIVGDAKGRGQTRGRATMYALTLCPDPDWNAAASIVWVAQRVKAEQRAARAERKATAEAAASATAPEVPASSGDSAPNSRPSTGSGDSHPNSAPASSGDSAPTEFGGQSPTGFGGQCPDHPGSTHELPHEMAGVGPQAEVARDREQEDAAVAAPPPPRLVPPQPGGDRPRAGKAKDSSCQGQRALLLPVRTPPHVTEEQAQLRATASDDEIRQAIRSLGASGAVYRYGRARVGPLLAELPDTDTHTGT
jgi:hypothetical protein